jgi:aspartate/methionine/tyrosine aminotransferase
MNSTELVTKLRVDKSVLIVPGDHFGMDGYLRIGFGDETAYLRAGLERLHDLIEEVRLKADSTYEHSGARPSRRSG